MNVYISNTGITHAKTWDDEQITRCGIQYVGRHPYRKDPAGFELPIGRLSGLDVDCMTCLVKDKGHNDAEWLETITRAFGKGFGK